MRVLINPHGVWGRLVFRHGSACTLIVSPPVIQEILEVLHRPELTRRFRSIAGLNLAHVIDILGRAEAVEVDHVPPVSRDPKGDQFLATAVVARADSVVTEDNDLLVLGAHQGIAIVTVSQFLNTLG